MKQQNHHQGRSYSNFSIHFCSLLYVRHTSKFQRICLIQQCDILPRECKTIQFKTNFKGQLIRLFLIFVFKYVLKTILLLFILNLSYTISNRNDILWSLLICFFRLILNNAAYYFEMSYFKLTFILHNLIQKWFRSKQA